MSELMLCIRLGRIKEPTVAGQLLWRHYHVFIVTLYQGTFTREVRHENTGCQQGCTFPESVWLSPSITTLWFSTLYIRSNANLLTLIALHLPKCSLFFSGVLAAKHETVNCVQLHIMEIEWDDMRCYKESSGDLHLWRHAHRYLLQMIGQVTWIIQRLKGNITTKTMFLEQILTHHHHCLFINHNKN